jgi:hypothetical protein
MQIPLHEYSRSRKAVVLQLERVRAAGELHARLDQWNAIDQAFDALKVALPDWSLSSTLLKVAVVDQPVGGSLRRRLVDLGVAPPVEAAR